jgi:uncharacterized protein YbjT (DUF2867 family)
VLLTEPAHDDLTCVTITGPESVTLAELAAIASEVTGDSYRYEPLGRDEWVKYRESWAGRRGRSRPGSRTTTPCAAARPTSSATTTAC